MNKDYFRIREEGLDGELAALCVEDVLVHFRNYRANFLLDRTLAVCYLDRFLAECGNDPAACAELPVEYLLNKCLQFTPFDIVRVHTRAVLDDPVLRVKSDILNQTNFEAETLKMIVGLDIDSESGEMAKFLHQLLDAYPNYALAAGKLLEVDSFTGATPTDWLSRFKCPAPLQADFNGMLFRHYAATGDHQRAEALFQSLPPGDIGEVNLNFAAEVARMRGDVPLAIARYKRSLELDRTQAPVRFRLAELESPSRKRGELVGEKKVAIYIYSYNKAKKLKATLASLAGSNIGQASVTVLLNGCTDDSLAVTQWARKVFPRNSYSVIPLHVNIGAPAARNWLINLPSTWENDYVAFLDDDVDVPEDWLEWYLTVAEGDPRIAVVGGKVVYPGRPTQLQYLFRYVSVATNGLLRLSMHAPYHQYDNGLYDFIRETRSVMGCLHLLRTDALRLVPNFDIRFSPSQVDDIDHDLCLCLAGYKVMYCGLVTCVHHQSSGVGFSYDPAEVSRIGNCIGNDVKLFYKHYNNMDELRRLDNLSLIPWRDV